jgi:hypothetical protein
MAFTDRFLAIRPCLKFFPDSFYKALKVPYRLSEGMAYHFLFMWLFLPETDRLMSLTRPSPANGAA